MLRNGVVITFFFTSSWNKHLKLISQGIISFQNNRNELEVKTIDRNGRENKQMNQH